MNFLLVILAITVNFEIYQWFNVGSAGVTTNDFITILMTILFLKITLWDGVELKLAKNPAILFYLLFLTATFISGLYPLLSGENVMIMQYFKTMLHFHFTFLIAAVLILYKFENDTWNRFIKVWLILSIGINVFGVYQIIARAFDLPFAWINLTNASFFSRNQNDVDEFTQLSLRFEGFFRATSFFSEPSALGAYNALTLVFAIIPKFKGFKPFLKSNTLNNVVILLCIIGLLLAFSLTGATVVAVILFTILVNEKLNVFFRVIKVLPFIIIFIIAANMVVENYAGISILELFGKRFGTLGSLLTGGGGYSHGIEGESVNMRGENFTALFKIWQSSPYIGVGLGLTYLSPFADGWSFSDTSIMAVLAELGLVGTIPYIGCFISMYFLGFRISNKKSIFKSLDENSQRLLSLIIYLMGFMTVTNFISGNNFSNISSALFIGLIISLINNYYIDYAKKYYILRFVDRPLRERFIKKKSDLNNNGLN